MKKKILVLMGTCSLTLGAVAFASMAFAKSNQESGTIKAGVDYTLTISDPIYEGDAEEGSGLANKIVKTTLGNDVKLEYNKLYGYQPGYYSTYPTGVNCMKADSYIAIVGNSEGHGVAGISSITFETDNDTYSGTHDLIVYYGWDDGDYLLSQKKETSDYVNTFTFTFEGALPSFAKIFFDSSNSDNRVGIHEITIEYECVQYSNPYHVEGDFGYKVYSDHATASFYRGTSADLVIPSIIDGKPVTTIEENFNCLNIAKKDIESVSLPSSLTSIGANAFKGAQKLDTINLDNVEYIGDYAFYYAESLVTIDLSSAEHIGDYAFTNCTALKDIGSFDSIVSIGEYAFYLANTLDDDLSFPATLTYIGDDAFMYAAIKSLTIHDNAAASIGNAAFRRCNYLTSVYIGDSVYRCDDFLYDGVLESLVVGENNTTYCTVDNVLYYIQSSNSWIGVRMAQNRLQTSYVMPEKVTSMFGYFAYGCGTLASLTFNDRVTSTGDRSFQSCFNLTSITFGSSIEEIGYSFAGCTSLTSVHIPGTIEHITQMAFNGCSALETVIIDEGVENIDKQAFGYCTSLTTAVIPSTLTAAGDDAGWDADTRDIFDHCTALTNVFTRLTSGGYSTSPSGPIYDGFYGTRTLNNYSESSATGCWHFDGSGNPVLW